jgi:GTP-binding protein
MLRLGYFYSSFCRCRSLLAKSYSDIAKKKWLDKLSVALVGRPNTGKSSLFNRLCHKRSAIVSNVPGTTRDRKYGVGNLAGLSFHVIDTGGLDETGSINEIIRNQVEQAIKEVDVVLFMIDSREGVTAMDTFFAKWIRRMLGQLKKSGDNGIDNSNKKKHDKDVIVIANKAEGSHLSDQILNAVAEALTLGLGDPILISAIHGDGLPDLANILIQLAAKRGYPIETNDDQTKFDQEIDLKDRVIQMAVMGKPNVGKSTFINSVINEERLIAGPIPGLTRYSRVLMLSNRMQFITELINIGEGIRLMLNGKHLVVVLNSLIRRD